MKVLYGILNKNPSFFYVNAFFYNTAESDEYRFNQLKSITTHTIYTINKNYVK